MIDFTGPERILDDSEPMVAGRRTRHGDPLDDTPDEPQPSHRSAARRPRVAATDDAAQVSRSRRRVAWRKGSDVDEELWPAEAFGGVSDEQFWDDLAADKPLATTARSAQPDTVARRRPPGPGPLPDLYPADDRGRGDARRGAAEVQGTHPRPDDRAAMAPVQAGIQPSSTPTVATQPVPTATQPVRAAQQPAEARGRSRSGASADEDPLTSPAYSLRRAGSVNGQSRRSSRRSPDLTREQHHGLSAGRVQPDAGRPDASRSNGYRPDPPRSDPLRSGGAYAAASVPPADYPYPQQPYGGPTRSTSASLQGERYGYGNPDRSRAQASPRSAPGRANGGWNPGRAGGNGAGGGNRGSYLAYPPANGYRAPYDPRGYERRLSRGP